MQVETLESSGQSSRECSENVQGASKVEHLRTFSKISQRLSLNSREIIRRTPRLRKIPRRYQEKTKKMLRIS